MLRVVQNFVHDAYDELVERYQWHRISCCVENCEEDNFTMRSIESINNEIYDVVKALLR